MTPTRPPRPVTIRAPRPIVPKPSPKPTTEKQPKPPAVPKPPRVPRVKPTRPVRPVAIKPPRPLKTPEVAQRDRLVGMLRLEFAALDMVASLSPDERRAYRRANPGSRFA